MAMHLSTMMLLKSVMSMLMMTLDSFPYVFFDPLLMDAVKTYGDIYFTHFYVPTPCPSIQQKVTIAFH